LQTISQLQEELIATRTQLLQMRTYTPRASQIPFLKTQVRELEREIARQTTRIAGGSKSLSANAARFQELSLASKFAEQQMAVALASLQDAQAEARRKQAYVERISDPSLPDYAAYPRRMRGILATLMLGLLAWGVLSMLLVGVREHRD
jgi:ABC-2 type transport system permease protein/capsular polysaccharide transport system permease protein